MAGIQDTIDKKREQTWIVALPARRYYLTVNDPDGGDEITRPTRFATKHLFLGSKKGAGHHDQKILNRALHRAGVVTGVTGIQEGIHKLAAKEESWRDKYNYRDRGEETGQHALDRFTNTVIDVSVDPPTLLMALATALAQAIDANWARISGVPKGTYDHGAGLVTLKLPGQVAAFTVTTETQLTPGVPLAPMMAGEIDLIVVPWNMSANIAVLSVEHLQAAR
jgi:hypothetical protein